MRKLCALLGLNRSSLYYKGKMPEHDDIELLNMIRDIWEKRPFWGYRKITRELRKDNCHVNRKRVQRLMSNAGIYAIYPGPNTSKRNQQHAVYPYLLRDLEILRANQVWMVDITYLRMPRGFVYLVALIDVYSRYVVGWSLSNTMETDFCINALEMALLEAIPDIINSDQGSQFTSSDWVDYVQEWEIRISMTGKGRCLDNVYIERFWRSFKQEEFYLQEYATIQELREQVAEYVRFYNWERWHQALDYEVPASVYFKREWEACGYDGRALRASQPPAGRVHKLMDNA